MHRPTSFLRAAVAAASLLILAPGCASNLGPDSYPRSEVGRSMRLEEGVIERVRPVRLEGQRTIVGPAAGAAIGGLVGSEIGGGDEERAIGVIAGAVLGGLAGRAVEEGVTRRDGVAYTVRLKNGALVNVVQEGPALLAPGQPVIVEYGDRTRVVPR
jgi:outer membrane lipoprotein SlyB